jgi:hypothetical protein
MIGIQILRDKRHLWEGGKMIKVLTKKDHKDPAAATYLPKLDKMLYCLFTGDSQACGKFSKT